MDTCIDRRCHRAILRSVRVRLRTTLRAIRREQLYDAGADRVRARGCDVPCHRCLCGRARSRLHGRRPCPFGTAGDGGWLTGNRQRPHRRRADRRRDRSAHGLYQPAHGQQRRHIDRDRLCRDVRARSRDAFEPLVHQFLSPASRHPSTQYRGPTHRGDTGSQHRGKYTYRWGWPCW